MCQEVGLALGTSTGMLSPGKTLCQEAEVLPGWFFMYPITERLKVYAVILLAEDSSNLNESV